MKKKKINVEKVRVNFLLLIFIFFLFVIFIARLCYLCIADYNVGTSTISQFIKNRNTEEEIIMPNRGTIYDASGNILAEDVASYTVIAYLNPTRSQNSEKPMHVVDITATAEALAPLLSTDKEILITLLSKDAYQVELGPGGRNLSQIQMEAVKNLNLPGIDFIKSTKRYYPNGNFASYTIGYTKDSEDEEGNIWKTGELGIEKYFNDTLTGSKGFITYEKDKYGYKISNGREYIEQAEDGDDVYLTIDNNIELFTENSLNKMENDSEAEWALMVVADANTGAILAYSSSPSFDPNIRDMTSYIDPLTGYNYEPGSTMKIFSYMCAIENGSYDGNITFDSGTITYESSNGTKTVIHDWNKTGWGNISLDQGFALSSNVGAATLLENNIITKKQLSSCYSTYGFGKATGFTLANEKEGSIKFNYDIEAATATFGQGITTTPIQMIQALTAISNDGEMLKPYIVSKVVDTDNDKITFKGNREVIDTVASSKTITKIKELMANVITDDPTTSTGHAYYMEDYPMIGKTGTAQIYDSKNGGYMTGSSDYIYSFAGLYPKESPEIIIYAAIKRPKDTTNYLSEAVKSVVVNTSKYLNISKDTNEYTSYTLDNYINKSTSNIASTLSKNGLKVTTIGSGEKIINQYPSKGSILYANANVILLTDNYNKEMLNLVGLSYKEAINILKLMGVKYTTSGSGYVYEQSIQEGIIVTDDMTVEIKLKDNYSG